MHALLVSERFVTLGVTLSTLWAVVLMLLVLRGVHGEFATALRWVAYGHLVGAFFCVLFDATHQFGLIGLNDYAMLRRLPTGLSYLGSMLLALAAIVGLRGPKP